MNARLKALVIVVVVVLAVALVYSGFWKNGPDGPREQQHETAVLPGATDGASIELTKLTIGYQPTIFYSYLFLAKDRGMFEKAGLDVELKKITSANKMFQALLAEQLDMTGLTATEIMFREYEQSPGTFICPLMVELNDSAVTDWVLVLNESPVKSIKDLGGKTIGSHPGTSVPNIMRRVLEANGVDPASVDIQAKSPSVQAEALLSGAVDALICLEPTGTRLLQTGKCRVLMRHPFGEIESAFPAAYTVLGNRFIENHPAAAESLQVVIKRSVVAYRKQAASDRTVLDKIVTEKLGLEPEVAANSSLATYRLPDEWDEGAFGRIVRFYVDLGVLSRSVAVTDIMP